MSLASTSIKRPTFITCVILVMMTVGYLAMKRMPVDLFPDVKFPIVVVTTTYPGAGPAEIETLISRPIEEEISTLGGLKRLSSVNQDGFSRVVAEFSLDTDIKEAEQSIRDRVGAAKRRLPQDVKDSVIRRIDPADQPVMQISVQGDLTEAELFDVADQTIRPKLEQVPQVGLVEVLGGRKREIHVLLDRDTLKRREISASQVASRLATAGENIPAGTVSRGNEERVYRTLGQFAAVKDIESTLVSFFGSDVPVSISQLGKVVDTLEDEKSRTYINGKKSLLLNVFRQSNANTIAVTDQLKLRMAKINDELQKQGIKAQVSMVRDGSIWIRNNIYDVRESILIGIVLAVIVVYFFLGSARSTLITGLAIPNSLIGAFILMSIAGFSINLMSLLALSLAVGLLVDDAIVVRENIFRHLEMGKTPARAALEGTGEVRLAVIATTFSVLAIFGPVGFLDGVVGQFFKEFGLTICFAMLISLFDALTIAPMLSAYLAAKPIPHGTPKPKRGLWGNTVGRLVDGFSRFQDGLELKYGKLVAFSVRRPILVLFLSTVVFLACVYTVKWVPKTFLPPQDAGEFQIALDLPPGTSLSRMDEVAQEVDKLVRSRKEVKLTSITVGGRDGESNVAVLYVAMTERKERALNTIQFKEQLREELKAFASANPKVKDYDAVGGGDRPFNLVIIGQDQELLEKISVKAYEKLKTHPALLDVDVSYRPGKPEFQIVPDKRRMQELGISSVMIGQELRTYVEGVTPAKFREKGFEYDVRLRLKEDQRSLKEGFSQIYVPNINGNLVRLANIANPIETQGPAKINRMDRGRYVSLNADIAPNGPGMGGAMADIDKMFKEEIPLPPGFRYAYVGQAENFQELGNSMAIAIGLGVLFIFLVLASLYESFITPLTIMLALPLAVCGSFVALAITQESLNIFSMIGFIMLLGVSTKNSILLVDKANQLVAEGLNRTQAMIEAGKNRLRPILMTTMALIAGTVPIAIGLNEASKQRTSMGIAIIGGLISSTLLTLVVIPAAYAFLDRFRVWSKQKIQGALGMDGDAVHREANHIGDLGNSLSAPHGTGINTTISGEA